jgi:hypothetical protein
MKSRTHFGHRIDMLDREGEIVEHLAGVEDSLLADATYEAALRLRRWPKVAIILRQGARVIRDSRRRDPAAPQALIGRVSPARPAIIDLLPSAIGTDRRNPPV